MSDRHSRVRHHGHVRRLLPARVRGRVLCHRTQPHRRALRRLPYPSAHHHHGPRHVELLGGLGHTVHRPRHRPLLHRYQSFGVHLPRRRARGCWRERGWVGLRSRNVCDNLVRFSPLSAIRGWRGCHVRCVLQVAWRLNFALQLSNSVHSETKKKNQTTKLQWRNKENSTVLFILQRKAQIKNYAQQKKIMFTNIAELKFKNLNSSHPYGGNVIIKSTKEKCDSEIFTILDNKIYNILYSTLVMTFLLK